MKKADGSGSRPPSRPPSRSSRKRADSTVSNATEKGDKEKDKADKGSAKKRSITGGWASSLSKMTSRGKNKEKGKFDTLVGDEDDLEDEDGNGVGDVDPVSAKSTPNKRSSSPVKSKISSRGNTPNASPQVLGRILRPLSQQDKKIAVALHDFAAASNDELSFKSGDQIIVLNEVVDGWWMGEHCGTGKTGLFPTTYTEILNASTSSLGSKPPLPRRPSNTALQPSLSRSASQTSAVKTKTKPPEMPLRRKDSDVASVSSDMDHPFGDNHMAASRSPLYGGFYDDSVTSDAGPEEDDDEARLMPNTEDEDDGLHVYRAQNAPPPALRRLSIPSSKKAPPPPPPRRATTTTPQLLTVPLRPGASRSNSSTRSNSTNNSFVSVADAQPDEEFISSPFDNPREGCVDFKQNPFKPKGFCSNCFQQHS